jgi:Flp pilus assembly CpaF family ATPase
MENLSALNPTQAEQLRTYRITQLTPLVDVRLPNGSRVNAIIPPCVLTAPTSRHD